jgi:hypothetical protein
MAEMSIIAHPPIDVIFLMQVRFLPSDRSLRTDRIKRQERAKMHCLQMMRVVVDALLWRQCRRPHPAK